MYAPARIRKFVDNEWLIERKTEGEKKKETNRRCFCQVKLYITYFKSCMILIIFCLSFVRKEDIMTVLYYIDGIIIHFSLAVIRSYIDFIFRVKSSRKRRRKNVVQLFKKDKYIVFIYVLNNSNLYLYKM